MGLLWLKRSIIIKRLLAFAWMSSLCVRQLMTSHRDRVKFQTNRFNLVWGNVCLGGLFFR